MLLSSVYTAILALALRSSSVTALPVEHGITMIMPDGSSELCVLQQAHQPPITDHDRFFSNLTKRGGRGNDGCDLNKVFAYNDPMWGRHEWFCDHAYCLATGGIHWPDALERNSPPWDPTCYEIDHNYADWHCGGIKSLFGVAAQQDCHCRKMWHTCPGNILRGHGWV